VVFHGHGIFTGGAALCGGRKHGEGSAKVISKPAKGVTVAVTDLLVQRCENPETTWGSGRKRLTGIGPAERLCQGFVEGLDEGGELGAQIIEGAEVAAADDFAREDGEPHLDLIEPGGVLWGEVKDDAVSGIAQKALARGHGLEDAALALDTEVERESAGVGDDPHQGFGAVDVEVVHDQVPGCGGGALRKQVRQPLREVLFGAGRPEMVGDLARDHVEGGDQGQGAVADVLELAPFDQTTTQRQGRRRALQGLHAGHLVDAAGLDPSGGALGCQAVGFANVLTLLVELGVAWGVDPTAGAVRLEIGLAQEATDRIRRNGLNDAARDGFCGQLGVRPMAQLTSVALGRLAGQRQDRADLLRGEGRRGARTRRVDQALQHREPRRTARPTPPPTLHRGTTDLQPRDGGPHTDAGGGQKDNLGAHHQALRRIALAHQRLQRATILVRDDNRSSTEPGHGGVPLTSEFNPDQHDNRLTSNRPQDFSSAALVRPDATTECKLRNSSDAPKTVHASKTPPDDPRNAEKLNQ